MVACGSGEDGAGPPTGAGVASTGAGVAPTGAGVLPTGAGVAPTGAGVLATGAGVVPAGAGVLCTVDTPGSRPQMFDREAQRFAVIRAWGAGLSGNHRGASQLPSPAWLLTSHPGSIGFKSRRTPEGLATRALPRRRRGRARPAELLATAGVPPLPPPVPHSSQRLPAFPSALPPLPVSPRQPAAVTAMAAPVGCDMRSWNDSSPIIRRSLRHCTACHPPHRGAPPVRRHCEA